MSTKRFSRIQRAAAIVPLALLSAAWTASLAGVGATSAVVSAQQGGDDTHLPDGSSVPSQAIEAPASVSDPDEASDGDHEADTARILANSSTNGIPSSALAAYQRAETVINSADKTCNLTWQLIAAIGRVESNHGRFGGNALDSDGVARPGIFGVALDGNGVSVIRDTDAGLLDGDTTYDRAVGPMQFIPSTWSVVGVDADNDGQRNPQDIDDAALAAAVYLCSGDNDLSTVAGQRASVYRYNHSTSYVNLVLRLMNNYLAGDFMSVPDGTTAAGYLVPEPPLATRPPYKTDKGDNRDSTIQTPQQNTPGNTNGGGDNGGDDNGGGQPDDNGGDNDGGGNSPLPQVSVPPLPSTEVEPLDEVLTLAQAIVQCTLDGISQLDVKAWNQCIKDYTT